MNTALLGDPFFWLALVEAFVLFMIGLMGLLAYRKLKSFIPEKGNFVNVPAPSLADSSLWDRLQHGHSD